MYTKKNVSKCFGLSLEHSNVNKKRMYVNKTKHKYCKKKTLKTNTKKKSGGSRNKTKHKYCKKKTLKANTKKKSGGTKIGEKRYLDTEDTEEDMEETEEQSESSLIGSKKSKESSSISDEGLGEEQGELLNGVNLNQLIHVCPDSGECMAIGREKDAIRDFFEFATFEYVEYPIKQIGSSSKNGFIKKIKYRRERYTAYALLKSSLDVHSDNLAYEYEVGLFINKICRLLPCFVETYDLYHYKNDEAYKSMRDNNDTPLNELLEIQNGPIDYTKACENPLHIAVLTEHLGNSITLKDLYEFFIEEGVFSPDGRQFFNDELPIILFQVYYGLAVLAMTQSFTHYDLHWENVLLYHLPESKYVNKYVNFTYASLLGEASVSFQTRYIAKIIDYGRCYYRDNETGISSLETYRTICGIPECDKIYTREKCEEEYGKEKCDELECPNDVCFTSRCGKQFGFSQMTARFHDEWVFNPSHDLLLLTYFHELRSGPISDILDRLDYTRHPIDDDLIDAVIKEDTYPDKISTVVDAAKILERFVKLPRDKPLVGSSVGTIIVDGIHELQYIPTE